MNGSPKLSRHGVQRSILACVSGGGGVVILGCSVELYDHKVKATVYFVLGQEGIFFRDLLHI